MQKTVIDDLGAGQIPVLMDLIHRRTARNIRQIGQSDLPDSVADHPPLALGADDFLGRLPTLELQYALAVFKFFGIFAIKLLKFYLKCGMICLSHLLSPGTLSVW